RSSGEQDAHRTPPVGMAGTTPVQPTEPSTGASSGSESPLTRSRPRPSGASTAVSWASWEPGSTPGAAGAAGGAGAAAGGGAPAGNGRGVSAALRARSRSATASSSGTRPNTGTVRSPTGSSVGTSPVP